MDSKTKVAGPLAAAGAVSLGLVFIGACGVGQEDTYVPPPPIRSGPQAVEQARYGDPSGTTTVAQILIPPSPSWRMAPEPPPRRTLPPEYQISVTSSPLPGETADPDETTDPGQTNGSDETTRRATLSATPGPSPSPDEDSAAGSPTATEIAPAHSESAIPPPAPTGTEVTPPAPASTTTVEATETPVAPEPLPTSETPESDSVPDTEPARTTSTLPGSGQSTPDGLPAETSETSVPESGAPVPTITIVPAVPPGADG